VLLINQIKSDIIVLYPMEIPKERDHFEDLDIVWKVVIIRLEESGCGVVSLGHLRQDSVQWRVLQSLNKCPAPRNWTTTRMFSVYFVLCAV
jgi:hypothetical protein